MMTGETCAYERSSFRLQENGPIRPGGLELTRKAVALSALCPGSLVLDIGCGTGAALSYMVKSCAFRAVGIDLSRVLLAEGRQKNPALLLAGASGQQLPFADATMDAILAECSLSVMEDVEKVLKECSRVLKRHGLLLVHDVYARNPHVGAALRRLPVECCLSGAASRQEWIERLEGRGFEVAVWEDHSSALKEFAARLIFSHGSLETFRRASGSAPNIDGKMGLEAGLAGEQLLEAISSVKPGYFLAVAKKICAVSCRG